MDKIKAYQFNKTGFIKAKTDIKNRKITNTNYVSNTVTLLILLIIKILSKEVFLTMMIFQITTLVADYIIE